VEEEPSRKKKGGLYFLRRVGIESQANQTEREEAANQGRRKRGWESRAQIRDHRAQGRGGSPKRTGKEW